MRILLARHGEDEDNRENRLNGRRDRPLTKFGEIQAYQLALRIKEDGFKPIQVFSGCLQRARLTAQICARVLSIPHTILNYIMERHHGILEGNLIENIPLYASKWRNFDGGIYIEEADGCETYPELCVRATQVYTKLIEAAKSGSNGNGNSEVDVLVVGHGALNRAIEIAHQGKTHENIFDVPGYRNCEYRILEIK